MSDGRVELVHEFPDGETVVSMQSHVGLVIIATNKRLYQIIRAGQEGVKVEPIHFGTRWSHD